LSQIIVTALDLRGLGVNKLGRVNALKLLLQVHGLMTLMMGGDLSQLNQSNKEISKISPRKRQE
jgi:hypothetical protein